MEYRQRTGRDLARGLLHKTSKFDPPEHGPKERMLISNDTPRRPYERSQYVRPID
jgi:hypothetical protein